MSKQMIHGLILITMLSGCSTALPHAARPGEHTLGAAAGFKAKGRVLPGSNVATELAGPDATASAAGQASTVPSDASAPADALRPVASNSAAAGAASAADRPTVGSPAPDPTPATVAVLHAPERAIKIVPIADDTNALASMLYEPEDALAQWQLQVSAGRSPALGKVLVTYRAEAFYPAQETVAAPSAPPAPHSAGASPPPGSLPLAGAGAAHATPATGFVIQAGPPVTFEKRPADVGLTAGLVSGGTATLKLGFDNDETQKFLAVTPNLARFSVTIALQDEAGQAIVSKKGKPFAIDYSAMVL